MSKHTPKSIPVVCSYPDCKLADELATTSRQLKRTAIVGFLLSIMMALWNIHREIQFRYTAIENVQMHQIIRGMSRTLYENQKDKEGILLPWPSAVDRPPAVTNQ